MQLADATRPVVLHERSYDLAIEGGEIPDTGIGTEEIFDGQRDILLILTQRRQVGRDDVSAVEEVLAYLSRGDPSGQITVGGGDDVEVGLMQVGSADRGEALPLDGVGEFGLDGKAQFPKLVEEKGSAVGPIEAALVAG